MHPVLKIWSKILAYNNSFIMDINFAFFFACRFFFLSSYTCSWNVLVYVTNHGPIVLNTDCNAIKIDVL